MFRPDTYAISPKILFRISGEILIRAHLFVSASAYLRRQAFVKITKNTGRNIVQADFRHSC